MTRLMPAQPEWLRPDLSRGEHLGVDHERRVILGYVVAERGPFKSAGRGEFNDDSLARIVTLMNAKPQGTKSRFAHPGMSDDGLGKFLGRAVNARVDGAKVRADLHLADAAFTAPSGNLGQYILDLAVEDPAAFGSSLVLRAERVYVLDDKGQRKKDARGEDLPPLWLPTEIHASDVVDEGDAVHGGFLSAANLDLDALPDALQRRGWECLDRLFAGQPRDVTEARVLAYLGRYLDSRYGPARQTPVAVLRDRLRLRSI